jgi:hypothetical protein
LEQFCDGLVAESLLLIARAVVLGFVVLKLWFWYFVVTDDVL